MSEMVERVVNPQLRITWEDGQKALCAMIDAIEYFEARELGPAEIAIIVALQKGIDDIESSMWNAAGG